MRKLMASILGVFGREERRGNGAFTLGRRRTDPEVRERRMATARVDAQARRLLSLTDAQVDAWRVR